MQDRKKQGRVCFLLRNNSSTIACFVKLSEKKKRYAQMILEKGDDSVKAAKKLLISWLAWEKAKHFFPNLYGFYA